MSFNTEQMEVLAAFADKLLTGSNLPISGLPAVTTPLDGTELTALVQGGVTKKGTVSNIVGFQGNYVISDTTTTVANQLATWNDTAGRHIINSGATLDVNGNMTLSSINTTTGFTGGLTTPAFIVKGLSSGQVGALTPARGWLVRQTSNTGNGSDRLLYWQGTSPLTMETAAYLSDIPSLTGYVQSATVPGTADGNFALMSGTSGLDIKDAGFAPGTISTQNANSVTITGGTIDGASVGATVASTGKFTDALTQTLGFTSATKSGLTLNNTVPASVVTPAAGDVIFDNVANVSKLYNGTSWVVTSGAAGLGTMAYENSNAVTITGGSGQFDTLKRNVSPSGASLYRTPIILVAKNGTVIDETGSPLTCGVFTVPANTLLDLGDECSYTLKGFVSTTINPDSVLINPQIIYNSVTTDLNTQVYNNMSNTDGIYAVTITIDIGVIDDLGTIKLAVDSLVKLEASGNLTGIPNFVFPNHLGITYVAGDAFNIQTVFTPSATVNVVYVRSNLGVANG